MESRGIPVWGGRLVDKSDYIYGRVLKLINLPTDLKRRANCADATAGGPAAGDAVGDLRTAAPPRLVWHLQDLCTGQVYVSASSRRFTVASSVRFGFLILVPIEYPLPHGNSSPSPNQ
jgi:hypothetical protein